MPEQLPPIIPSSPRNYAEWLEKVSVSLQSPQAKTKDALDPERAAHVKDIETDIELKKMYAHWFIWILIGQLFVMNLVFVSVGAGWLQYENLTLQIYMSGTLAEVFGVVFVITRYLFSKRK
jgi:hypothetical protein